MKQVWFVNPPQSSWLHNVNPSIGRPGLRLAIWISYRCMFAVSWIAVSHPKPTTSLDVVEQQGESIILWREKKFALCVTFSGLHEESFVPWVFLIIFFHPSVVWPWQKSLFVGLTFFYGFARFRQWKRWKWIFLKYYLTFFLSECLIMVVLNGWNWEKLLDSVFLLGRATVVRMFFSEEPCRFIHPLLLFKSEISNQLWLLAQPQTTIARKKISSNNWPGCWRKYCIQGVDKVLKLF